jgi:hypothetical protein
MHRIRTLALTAVVVTTMVGVAPAASAKPHDDKDYTFAVIGDIPYGDTQIAAFPARISQLNADPDVRFVTHLGDIKNGSSVCSDDYFALIKTDFDGFVDPLVYTPGDNEWTDCHRANNGSYNPLERLAKVREVFFPTPGVSLGQNPIRVSSQAAEGVPENVSWSRGNVAFAAVNLPGSNNSLAPWTGNTVPTPDQSVEVLSRTASDIELIRDTFHTARAEHDRGVAIMLQADMFDPTVASPQFVDYYGFKPIVLALAQEAARFNGPVYLFNGDSHVFNQDNPLAAGSSWLTFYGVSAPVPNLARITVEGSTGVDEWLKVTAHDHGADVLTFERVSFAP